ncbi:hypothetical protein FDUTEX481_05153 [Tolypothrix sp. PCC 7601]|nr:hypothetical protein FDUTEX481_05153 [Tolypothrix sp. PCC 7601]
MPLTDKYCIGDLFPMPNAQNLHPQGDGDFHLIFISIREIINFE